MFLSFLFSHFSILLLFCLNVTVEVENSGVKSSSSQDGIYHELDSFELVSPAVLDAQERWRRDASTRTKLGHRENVVVMLQRRTKHSFVLDLTLNRDLLVSGFVSKHYDNQGRLVTSRAKPEDRCFYQGTLRGVANSVVSISTCKGIEGLIHDGNESYYVQPVNKEGVKQHILYNMKNLKLKEGKCATGQGHTMDFRNLGSFSHESSFGKHRVRRNTKNEVKYVELVLVNDYAQFEHYKNLKDTEYRGKHVLNLVDSLYRPLNIRVALLMMITWSNGNKIPVDTDSDKTLSSFLKYRQKEIVSHLKSENIKSHDNAQLLSRINFKSATVGKAQVMAMCSTDSGAVVKDHSENAWATAATLAHELGHNFGLHHDDDYNNRDDCKCNEETGCIMSGIARHKPATEWSPCSREELAKMFKRGLDSCLFNQPRRLYGDAVCGNGFKEEGEECDCGTLEECKRYTDNCCNATTCKLHPYAECSEGVCCDKCKFKTSGSECRAKINSCDVPEYCNGKSELCPENVYVQNGWPCDKGYCFNGRCPNQDQQCEDLWGKGAKNGPFLCYTSNKDGKRQSNCGVNSTTKNFVKCKRKDLKCGKLWCEKETDGGTPLIGVGRTGYRHKFPSGVECWSATVDVGGDEVSDPTMVLDGGKCGDNEICHNAKCIHIHEYSWLIASSLCPSNCSGNGVCTTKSECFCDPCWGGNDCSKSVTCPWESEARTAVAGIVIAVFLILLLIIGLVFAYKHRRKLYEKWQNYNIKRTGTRRYDHISTGTPKTGRSEVVKKGSTKAQATSNPTKPPKARLEISGPVKTDSSAPATVVTPYVTTTPKPPSASKPASSGQPNLPSWPPASTPEKKPVFNAKSWHDKDKEQPPKAMWKAPVKNDSIASNKPSSGVAPPKKSQWPPQQKEQDNVTSRKPLKPPPLHRASSPPGTLDDKPGFRPQPKTRPGSLAGVLNQEKPSLPEKPGNDTQLSKKPSFGRTRPSPLARKPSGAQEVDSVNKTTVNKTGLPVSRKPSGAQNLANANRQPTAPTKPPLPLGRKPSGAQDLDGVKKGLRPTGVLPGTPAGASGARQNTPGGKVPLRPPGKQPSSQR